MDVILKDKRAPGKSYYGVSRFAVALAFFALSAAGCASAPAQPGWSTMPQAPLIWPSPPEPARISYLRTISRPEDIGANSGFFKRLADFILGAKSERIIKPYGVAVDSAGRLIVADTAFKKVHVFDMVRKKYTVIDEPGREQFASPIAAATDGEDNIYVTDSVAQKVFVFNSSGKFRFSFAAGERPTGIAINKADGRVYVTDTASHSVRMYDLGGAEVGSFGRRGKEIGEFNYPVDLALDRGGDLYVVDSLNFRVQMFDGGGSFLGSFGRQGDGTGDFGRPKGIAVDRDGNVYVADALFDTVQIFNRQGEFLLNFGTLGKSAGTFWLPSGVFIDDGNRIYISDSYNGRVQVFDYLGS